MADAEYNGLTVEELKRKLSKCDGDNAHVYLRSGNNGELKEVEEITIQFAVRPGEPDYLIIG